MFDKILNVKSLFVCCQIHRAIIDKRSQLKFFQHDGNAVIFKGTFGTFIFENIASQALCLFRV